MKLSCIYKLIAVSTVATTASLAIARQAQAVTLNFEGLRDNERVRDFYNNGTGSQGSTGTNYGASFTGGNNSGATGEKLGVGGPNFTNPPSPDTVMFMVGNSNNFLNIASGFTGSFSFAYGSRSNQSNNFIRIFDGLYGMGNQLAVFNLPSTTNNNSTIDIFDLTNIISFAGVAKSVKFDLANANLIAFDDLSFTPVNVVSTQVPEPFTVIGTIVGGLAAVRMKKRLKLKANSSELRIKN